MLTRRDFVSLLSSLPLIGALFSDRTAGEQSPRPEQSPQSKPLPQLVPGARVNVFDWHKKIVFCVQHGYTGAEEYKMPPGKIELFDTKTGEEVCRVIAYDAGRNLVTRSLVDGRPEDKGDDGDGCYMSYMDATWDDVAKTTERRRLFARGDSVLAGCINSAKKSWLS